MFLTSYQRQELGTRRPKQTAFPRTGPGGGREEEKRRGNPLPASPGEGCPPPSVPTPHAPGREPGCPCSALPQRGCGGGGRGTDRHGCARRDGSSWRTPGVKGRRQPRRHGTRGALQTQSSGCETLLLQREPHRGSKPERNASPPLFPPPGKAAAPGPALTRPHPAAHGLYVPDGTAVGRHSCSPAHPGHSPRPGSSGSPSCAALAGALTGPPPGFIDPARTISVFLGRVHLCR